mgnify:CR=1 FL=1
MAFLYRQPDLNPLARELLDTPDGLLQVLPWLTSGEATGAWRLGECLAALDPQGNLEPLLVTDANHGGDWRLLCGYLNAKHAALGDGWYDRWLQRYAHASSPSALGMWFDVAWLCGVTETGAVLIEALLRNQSVSERTVSRLALGQWSLDLPAPSLQRVLQAMIDTEHRATALQILSHRVEQKGEEVEFWSEIARDLILDLVPLRANDHLEYPWKALALPYVGTQATALTRAILDSHLDRHGAVWFLEFSEAKIVLIECAKREPALVWGELESRLSGPEAERIVAMFPQGVLEHLPVDAILHWVSENPELRATFLADLTPGTFASDQTLEARLVGLYGHIQRVKRSFLNALTRSWVGQASDHKEEVADRLDEVAGRTALPKLRRWAEWASRKLRKAAEQEIAEGIGAELVDHLVRVNDVAAALGHLLAIHRPPAMGEDRVGERLLERHQHGGPVHGVRGENIFPDQMDIGGPVTQSGRLSLRQVFERGDVIDQRIEPDVGDIVLVEGKFDAPGESRFGSGDREVAQLLSLQKAQDFVAARFRSDEVRMLQDVPMQLFLILAHLEEIIVLTQLLDRALAVRAEPADDIFFRPEPFVERAIPTRVVCLVNQLLIEELLKISLNHGLVGFVGGADEGVVGNVQPIPEVCKLRCEAVAVRLGIDAGLRGGLLHFLSVFVETGQEKYVASTQSPVAREHIGGDGGVGMTDVRHVVDVVDRCRDVEGVASAHGLWGEDSKMPMVKASWLLRRAASGVLSWAPPCDDSVIVTGRRCLAGSGVDGL